MTTFANPFQLLESPRFPAELILNTIEHLPFGDGKTLDSIRSVSPRLNHVFTIYERSITRFFMRRELRHALADFPCKKSCDLNWLAQCVARYDVVDAVLDELTWRENRMAVKPHNVSVVNAGLLLLYQFTSIEDHCAKLAFIKSLPRDPLTAIYLATHHATLTARYHGHGWIHQPTTYGRFMDANQLSLRNELEFCFAEATLSVGPDFFYDMLVNPSDPAGELTLLNFYLDHATHDWEWPCWGDGKGEFEPPRVRGPQRESMGRSLFTTLLERLTELVGCTLDEVRARVEAHTDAQDHPLAFLSLAGKERLVQGLDVVDA